MMVALWDFAFYALLGLVITFAVRIAGVVLVPDNASQADQVPSGVSISPLRVWSAHRLTLGRDRARPRGTSSAPDSRASSR